MNIGVIMAENKIIHQRPGRGIISGELIQRLILTFKYIFIIMREPVPPGPSVPQTESYPRVQHAEKELQNPVMEHAPQETVTERHGPEAVPMAEAEPLPSDSDKIRLLQADHPQLLEI